jgi:uncharacterized membrane protein
MNNPSKISKLLLQLSALSFALLTYRILKSGSLVYIFLAWNLFLAWIPYLLSAYAIKQKSSSRFILKEFALCISWLLFLPNAPYLLTDFVHLHERAHLPFWYDLLVLLSFSLTGLLLFMFSFYVFSVKIISVFRIKYQKMITYSLFVLCGYGLYLGRCLRYNSWDVISNPFGLIASMFRSVTDPHWFKETVGMSILFGLFLYFGYKVFMRITQLSSPVNHESELFN